MQTTPVLRVGRWWSSVLILGGVLVAHLGPLHSSAGAQAGWEQQPAQPAQSWGSEPVQPTPGGYGQPGAQPPPQQAWAPPPAQPAPGVGQPAAQPYGQGAYVITPPGPTLLPLGVRFALDFPVLSYRAVVSGSGESKARFLIGGGAVDIGYAPSSLLTVGAMVALAYFEEDVVAEILAYVDIAPGRSRTRFFIRPEIGGSKGPGFGGWIAGVRIGARMSILDNVTVEPWAEFRYNSLSSGSFDFGIAALTVGVSVALWGATAAAEPANEPPTQFAANGGGYGPQPGAGGAWQAQPTAPPNVPANAPLTVHVQSAEIALDLTTVSSSEVGILLTRNPALPGASFDACREARFFADGALVASVPLESIILSQLSARIAAGRLPALTRARQLTIELCGASHPLPDGPTLITDFLQRFARAGGVIDERAAAPTPIAPAPAAPGPAAPSAAPAPATSETPSW